MEANGAHPLADRLVAYFAGDAVDFGDVRLELDGLTAVFDPDGEFLALYEPRGAVAKPVAVFV